MIPQPSESCAIKLASLVRHADELIDAIHSGDDHGADFDIASIRSLLSDHEVMAYMISLDRLALLPVKRR